MWLFEDIQYTPCSNKPIFSVVQWPSSFRESLHVSLQILIAQETLAHGTMGFLLDDEFDAIIFFHIEMIGTCLELLSIGFEETRYISLHKYTSSMSSTPFGPSRRAPGCCEPYLNETKNEKPVHQKHPIFLAFSSAGTIWHLGNIVHYI